MPRRSRTQTLCAVHRLLQAETTEACHSDLNEMIVKITRKLDTLGQILASAIVVLNLHDDSLDLPLIEVLTLICDELPDDTPPAALAQAA